MVFSLDHTTANYNTPLFTSPLCTRTILSQARQRKRPSRVNRQILLQPSHLAYLSVIIISALTSELPITIVNLYRYYDTRHDSPISAEPTHTISLMFITLCITVDSITIGEACLISEYQGGFTNSIRLQLETESSVILITNV